MSLTSALSIAQRSLLNTGRQTSIVSRNIAEQSNPDYSRRSTSLDLGSDGAQFLSVQRATNEVLFKQNLSALSSASGQNTLLDGLNQLATAVNGASNDATIASGLGKLQEALTLYAASPSNRTLALNAVEAARQLVGSLNNATQALQSFRTEADAQIATNVDDLNQLLAQFQDANQTIVAGTRTGADVNEAYDQRDKLLKQIAEIIPVSATTRADNDISLVTQDGVVLFDKVPRSVSFTPSAAYQPSSTGNRVYVDGVPLAPAATSDAQGSLSALLHLRDEVAPTMQTQLDEIARGVTEAFAVGGSAGLVTWVGSGSSTDVGFAGVVRINVEYDANAGGDPELLRGAGSAASDGTQIQSFLGKLEAPFAFSAAAGLGSASRTLGDFATMSVSWLDGQRKTASEISETKSALATRTAAALSNATGVNIDEEMSLLLELEHSYQASARILKAVDEMLLSLMNAVS